MGSPEDIAQGARVLDVSSPELPQVPPKRELVRVILRCRKLEWCFVVGGVFWGLVGVGGGETCQLFYASFLLFLSCRIEEQHTDIRNEQDSSRKGRRDR